MPVRVAQMAAKAVVEENQEGVGQRAEGELDTKHSRMCNAARRHAVRTVAASQALLRRVYRQTAAEALNSIRLSSNHPVRLGTARHVSATKTSRVDSA